MKLKDKFLRYPLAPEVLALLEKIDSIESVFDTSYYPIKKVLNLDGFSRYERWMLVRSFSQIEKRHAYSCAMHVVVKNEMPEDPDKVVKSSILTRGAIIKAAQQEFNKAFAAQQASNLANNHGGIAHGLHSSTPYDIYKNTPQ
jgi:hypothetical protein